MRRKRITKIYNRIMEIVTKGTDSNIEYYNYRDDLVDSGEYSLLQDVFSTCFDTDITLYPSIMEFKKRSFKVVLTYTYSYFQTNLKNFYDENDVYQVGKSIFESSSNVKLGEFTEVDRVGTVNHQGVTYSYYPENVFYRNTELFHKLDEARVVELIVLIGSDVNGSRILLSDPNMQLIDKYKYAISILKSANINNYIDSDYVFDYYI